MVVALICVSLGWTVDRSRTNATRAELEEQVDCVAEGGLWWSMAEHARQLSLELKEPTLDLDSFNRRNLVTKLFWLFHYQPQIDQWCETSGHGSTAASLAGKLLVELNCKSYDEFIPIFLERFKSPRFHSSYIDKSTDKYIALKSFIEESLE